MPVDHARLLAGLSAAAQMMTDEAKLSAIDVLVTAVGEATGALGATFTEYGPDGGRVVAATGAMGFALGQPISAEFIDASNPDQVITVRVDTLPAQIAEPLLGRDVGILLGKPVPTLGRVVGALHLYFAASDQIAYFAASEQIADVGMQQLSAGGAGDGTADSAGDDTGDGAGEQVRTALRIAAAAIAHHYCGAQVPTRAALTDDDDRSLFLAVAGHELRTPVTVLKGYASMLADRWDSLDDSGRRDAARVLTQRADELARLVDRLLGASVGEGAMGWLVRAVPFDLVGALLRAVGDLPLELRRDVRLELPNSLPLACGDPTILTSIIAELVTNAVRNTAIAGKSVAAGSAAIGVALDGEAPVEILADADADTVFIRVCDRGLGIDPGHVERAFEKFWRANRDSEGLGGVGLGLFLVRRLVERQKGWVSLRPREGGGTVAEVRLPRADGGRRAPAGKA